MSQSHRHLEREIERLTPLVLELRKKNRPEERLALLLPFGEEVRAYEGAPKEDERGALAFYGIAAIGQAALLFRGKRVAPALLATLAAIDSFFWRSGGVVGYHLKVLQKICERSESPLLASLPECLDLTEGAQEAVRWGIETLPRMGEMVPLGGLGTRLNLRNERGEPLPAALLPFGGRTLLEGLVRDVRGREFLHAKLFGWSPTTPLALMTSPEENNHGHILALCEERGWFGRPKESFRLFSQLSVPVVTEDGEWVLRDEGELHVQPGGHGAIWPMAQAHGVFEWFQEQGREGLLIRQINNPLAGIDGGLLAFMGVGLFREYAFGFASCPRIPEMAEGVLVSLERGGERVVANIEYTDFAKQGIRSEDPYPANTNILYAHIERVVEVISKEPSFGALFNPKNPVLVHTESGEKRRALGGRLESMMQSLGEAFPREASFVTYNRRQKTISPTKRAYEGALLETPEGAFYDLQLAAHELLQQCGVQMPPVQTQEAYIREGPASIFLYHPALGPLYEIIEQKIRGGRMGFGAELQLELAELLIENLELEGTLLIEAADLERGRCVLRDVQVVNRGIDRAQSSSYWKNRPVRREKLEIILHGDAEFHAEESCFKGDLRIEVPSGERWVYRGDCFTRFTLDSPSWNWNYALRSDRVELTQEKRPQGRLLPLFSS